MYNRLDHSIQDHVQSPSTDTNYSIVTCRSEKTINLVTLLFRDYGIHAWAPRVVNKFPKKGQKRVRAAVPGFAFIPEYELGTAVELQHQRKVPQFYPLVVNGVEHTCSHNELKEFERAVKSEQAPEVSPHQRISVGDSVTVLTGPFKGLQGLVKEVFIRNGVMVTLSSGTCPFISLPAAYVS